LASAMHRLLGDWAAQERVVLLIDDVQWIDVESSAVIGYARRRLTGRLLVVATLGDTAGEGPGDEAGARVDVSGLHHLDVEALATGDLVDLLCDLGLTPDIAQRISVESGGLPSAALAMAGAIGQRPAVLGSPTPVPSSIVHVLGERVRALPRPAREALTSAALLHRPTVRQLERSGRLAAADEARRAVRAGLLAAGDTTAESGCADGALRFTPSVLRRVVTDLVPAEVRAQLHRELAESAGSEAERLRHVALSDPRPCAELAHALAAAADDVAGPGSRDLSAELYLLAVDRAPSSLTDERLEWVVKAVETAAPGNHVELVRRAMAYAFDDLRPGPSHRVRLRLAIPELPGNGVALLDEVLAAALDDAGDDDHLVAQVLLQRARIALMESRPAASSEAAERAVELLERRAALDPEAGEAPLALALTTLVASRRWLGLEHAAYLDRAVRLAGPTPTGFLHISPGYMAARFAFYDDRLEEARTAFLSMLGRVERGAGMDHVHVLRCLVEVAARTGRCAEAVTYAARAAAVGAEFDIDAHAAWFISAQAELLVGDLARARTLALRGAEVAGAAGDIRYLQRHLIVLGHALLRTGDARGAVSALERVRVIEQDGGFGDPTVNRWHADLVTALVALGRLREAADLLVDSRYAVDRRAAHGGTSGVIAALDRAEAELALARGDLDAAEQLLERSSKIAADLGLRVEQGRTLITRAHLERRRRRAAASRATLQEAHALFASLGATAWVAQVQAELSPTRGPDGHPVASGPGGVSLQAASLLAPLTESEARVARAVASGASNREIAERTFVSVKTVEATLTRVYRKLDVGSRTRLAALLAPTLTQADPG
ncbi:helix-turn-helix transcriptional regulator, partial [Nocardioides sp.]|uniref:helix-turn-helix transcriptional regulator n=1 Tax=Nocardioides sp. TaxID=35761 RepID=UPI002B27B24C